FKECLTEENRKVDSILDRKMPTSLALDRDVIALRKNINQNVEDLSNGHLGKIISNLNNHFKTIVGEYKQSILENIKQGNLLMDKIDHSFPGRLDLEYSSQSLEVDFS